MLLHVLVQVALLHALLGLVHERLHVAVHGLAHLVHQFRNALGRGAIAQRTLKLLAQRLEFGLGIAIVSLLDANGNLPQHGYRLVDFGRIRCRT